MGTMPLLLLDAFAFVRMVRNQGHVLRTVLAYTEDRQGPTEGRLGS